VPNLPSRSRISVPVQERTWQQPCWQDSRSVHFKIWSAVPIGFSPRGECARPAGVQFVPSADRRGSPDSGNRLRSAKVRADHGGQPEEWNRVATTSLGDYPIRESLAPEVPILARGL